MSEHTQIDLPIGNYRGMAFIDEEDGKYYLGVECDLYEYDEYERMEITKELYIALKKYVKAKKA